VSGVGTSLGNQSWGEPHTSVGPHLLVGDSSRRRNSVRSWFGQREYFRETAPLLDAKDIAVRFGGRWDQEQGLYRGRASIMQCRGFRVIGAILCVLAIAGRSKAQERSETAEKINRDQHARLDAAADIEEVDAAPLEFFPIPAGTVFERHNALAPGADAATAGADEQLVYSNTLGIFGAALGAGRLVADDLTVTIPDNCQLKRFEFPVIGKVDPNGIGGPYTVDFALYTSCPQSVPTSLRPTLIIPGTQGQAVFADDAPRLISLVAPSNVPLKTNMWLGVKFSRNNAGPIVGTPPLGGFSCDIWDFPGFACNSNLGGFPNQPQASYNLEIYADSACTPAFTGYKNHKPSGAVFNPGAGIEFLDDIAMAPAETGINPPDCEMIAYEVAVRGVGFYTFDLRRNCDATIIAGTQRFFSIGVGGEVKTARFSFDPPIHLPSTFFFGAKINNSTGGIVVTGQQACIGANADFFGLPQPGGCQLIPGPPGIHAALDVAITCAGAAPVGACCDMFVTDEDGDSVCRQVPQTNCPFPPRFSSPSTRPDWEEGEACDPDPFRDPCGQSACCTPDGGCDNLTQNECNAVPPLDSPRQWQIGRFCNVDGQRCPRIACLARTGECTQPRVCPPDCPPTGCEVPDCCEAVCNFDAYCCETEWDQTCADYARELCDIRPSNDVCAPFGRLEGARLLPVPGTAESDSGRATEEINDPGFGCHGNGPGLKGLQTIWYKFIATHTTASLQTCNSNSPADDSLLAIFSPEDRTSPVTECNSLIPIGCNDDFNGCSDSDTNSRICVRNLIPGNLYYVLIASKTEEAAGTAYRLDIAAPCTVPPPVGTANNHCTGAATILNGTTAFNLGGTCPTSCPEDMDAPAESCIPGMVNDEWYKYTATCSGVLTVETCGTSPATSPDTNLAIYEDCKCPYATGGAPPLGCSRNAAEENPPTPNCGLGSKIQIDVTQGRCYGIRLADEAENFPSGNLKIGCVQATCPGGVMTFTDPPNGVVSARRPHAPGNPAQLEGLQVFTAIGPRDAQLSCFTLCETGTTGAANSIANIAQVENPPGTFTYTITLTRPITPGQLTTISYTDTHGIRSTGRFTSHPGNVRGDDTTSIADVTDLIAALDGTFFPPWSIYSVDINGSGLFTPADILEEIDLMTDGGPFDPPPGGWDGSFSQSNSPLCP